jgi:hypothetical protein
MALIVQRVRYFALAHYINEVTSIILKARCQVKNRTLQRFLTVKGGSGYRAECNYSRKMTLILLQQEETTGQVGTQVLVAGFWLSLVKTPTLAKHLPIRNLLNRNIPLSPLKGL